LEKFEAGELKATAYIGGKAVAEHKVVTAGTATNLRLTVDTSGKTPQAGVNDSIFVYAQLVDSKGNPVRDNNVRVKFNVDGAAQLISPAEVVTTNGIASALIQIGDSLEDIDVGAESNGINSSSIDIR
jgi:beta-galactosidase